MKTTSDNSNPVHSVQDDEHPQQIRWQTVRPHLLVLATSSQLYLEDILRKRRYTGLLRLEHAPNRTSCHTAFLTNSASYTSHVTHLRAQFYADYQHPRFQAQQSLWPTL